MSVSTPPPMTPLTSDDIEKLRPSFEETGYLVFKNVVAKDKLSALRDALFAEYERATRAGELFAGGGRISVQVLNDQNGCDQPAEPGQQQCQRGGATG